MRSVQLKCHDVDSSLLEGTLCRSGRQAAAAIESAWRRGARFDAWNERLQPQLWWDALAEAGIGVEQTLHQPYPVDAHLPWDHICIHQGRSYLEREQEQSAAELSQMCMDQ